MKIIVAGMFLYSNYEEEFSNALSELGIEVYKLRFKEYFSSFVGKVEYHLNFNLINIKKVNDRLTLCIEEEYPDILFIWRGTFIYPETLIHIKKKYPNIILVSYNNDDPFSQLYRNSSNLHQRNLWKRFVLTIPHYDINFVFRPQNILDYKKANSIKTFLLPPYFNENKIQQISIPDYFDHDVVFIGHPEPHRIEIINYLIINNIDVKVFGNWKGGLIHETYSNGAITPIYGSDYYNALNRNLCCLSFYSKLNRDEYTIRSFEIPAAKGVLVSERTKAMESMFVEGKEALYFSNKEECLSIINNLKIEMSKRNYIAENGYKKVYELNAEVKKRARYFIDTVIDSFS